MGHEVAPFDGFEESGRPKSQRLRRLIGGLAARLFPEEEGSRVSIKDDATSPNLEQQLDGVFAESEVLNEEYRSALERGQDFVTKVKRGLPPAAIAAAVFLEDRPVHEVANAIETWVSRSSPAFEILDEETTLCAQHQDNVTSGSKFDYADSVNKAEQALYAALSSMFWRDYMD